jgi:acyl carrier protein
MVSIFEKVQGTLADILDIEHDKINPESYLLRDLEAESIDLLELAVTLNSEFNIEVNDDEIFLKTLRVYLDDPKEHVTDVHEYLMEKYPFLTLQRVNEIMDDIENGPVLKIKDLISYIKWQSNER